MQSVTNVSPAIGNFEQPVLPIVDPQAFNAVRDAIQASFSPARLVGFLKSLSSKGLRIRSFETVLAKGLLGGDTRNQYNQLGNADQGQIREFYLASLEKVAPETREKFFKLYAYY